MKPLEDYWAVLHVRLREPLKVEDEEPTAPVVGYYITFGVRARSSEVEDTLRSAVHDGEIDWSDSQWGQVDRYALDPEIQARTTDPSSGIWYRSGRAYYPEKDEDEPSDATHFVADGPERALASPEVQAELAEVTEAIERKYQALLANASFLRRLLLIRKKRAEMRDAVEKFAPSRALYSSANGR